MAIPLAICLDSGCIVAGVGILGWLLFSGLEQSGFAPREAPTKWRQRFLAKRDAWIRRRPAQLIPATTRFARKNILAVAVLVSLSRYFSEPTLSRRWRTFARAVQRAGYPGGLLAQEWFILIGAMGCLTVLAGVFVGQPVLFLVAALMPVAAWLWLGRYRTQRAQALRIALPGWFRVLALLLRSGLDLVDAWQHSVDGTAAPLHQELIVGSELWQTGATANTVWRTLAESTGLAELNRLGSAIILQMESGGSLAPILEDRALRFESALLAAGEQAALEAPLRILPAMLVVFAVLFLLLLVPVAGEGL